MEPSSSNDNQENTTSTASSTKINVAEELHPADTTTTTIIKGTDSEGRHYSSIADMWKAQGVSTSMPQQTKHCWYDKAAAWYEANCPPTVNGVLGGYAHISDLDLQGSRLFLDKMKQNNWSRGAAAECGAGIGRVTKGLLLDLGVTHCDLIESSANLLYEAPEYLGDEAAAKCRFYHCGLQDWEPLPQKYSIIWIQWVLCYLTDEDVVAFLQRCAKGLLLDTGIIVLKENTCGDGNTFVVDNEDASVCRSLPYWLTLVEAAGLRVIQQTVQSDFPDDLFPVPILALEPACRAQDHSHAANAATTTTTTTTDIDSCTDR